MTQFRIVLASEAVPLFRVSAMDINHISLFVLIADCGSLSRTAAKSGLSQPTVSRNLKDLEELIGAPLFERLPNHLELTAMGQQLLEPARAVKSAADAFAFEAKVAAQAGLPPVRISATQSVSSFLARHAAELQQAARNNGTEVQIDPDRTALLLADRQAEIMLRLRRIPDSGAGIVRRVGSLGVGLYAAQTAGEPDHVIGLTANRPGPQPQWLDGYASSSGLPIVLRFSDYYLRHQAVNAGTGLTLLPSFCGDSDSRLRKLEGPIAELQEDIFMIVQKDKAQAASVRKVADVLAVIFATHGHELSGAAQTTQPPA